MKAFFNFLVKSNIFIAFAAISHYFFYATEFKIAAVIIIFTSTFFAYHALRLSAWKLKKKYIGHENIRFYYNQKILLALISLFLIVLSISHFSFNLISNWFFLGTALILILFYENPILKWEFRKSILKPFIISLVWTLFTFSFISNISHNQFLDSFVFILLLCLPFDIKDRVEDRKEKLKTVAFFLKTKTKLTVTTVFFIYASFQFYITFNYFYFIAAFLYYLGVNKFIHRPIIFYLIFDGLIILRCLIDLT